MNHQSHPPTRLAVLATTVLVLVSVTAGRATAQHPRPDGGNAPGSGYEATIPAAQQVTDNSDRTLQWVLLAAIVFGALAIVAVVADVLGRRRWRQPSLETALASSDPEELPRAAGLLANLFVQQDRDGAAEHAYRAAIEVGDAYWSPIAQVALAGLLSDRGEHAEAHSLLEAAITSGHPRAVQVAQASLTQLRTGTSNLDAASRLPKAYETLGQLHTEDRRQTYPSGLPTSSIRRSGCA